MTEKERKKAIKELKKKIIPRIKVGNLIKNPEKNIPGQRVLDAKAILKSFNYKIGEELERMINKLLDYSRAGTRDNHVKNLALEIKKYIIEKTGEIVIFILVFFVVVIFIAHGMGYSLEKVKAWFGIFGGEVSFREPEGNIPQEPVLKFNDVIFVYYNSEGLMGNSNEANYREVDLEDIERVGFVAELKNIGQADLVYSTKWITIRLPDGTPIRDGAPDGPSEDSIIHKAGENETGLEPVMMGDIPAESLLQSMNNDKNFFLSFEPIINYNTEENWSEEEIPLNRAMDCRSYYNWNLKKMFKPACNERVK